MQPIRLLIQFALKGVSLIYAEAIRRKSVFRDSPEVFGSWEQEQNLCAQAGHRTRVCSTRSKHRQDRGPGTAAPAPSTCKPTQPRPTIRQRPQDGWQQCPASLVPPSLARWAATQESDPFACVGSPNGSPCPLRRLYDVFQLSLPDSTLHSPYCSFWTQHAHHVNGNTLF